jgi:hypothetical protein
MDTELLLDIRRQKFCRCCLLVDEQQNMKFLNMRTDTVQQITIIESFLKHVILPEDIIALIDENPKICHQCAIQLENIVLFKAMCSKANELLHQKIAQEQNTIPEFLGFDFSEIEQATQQLSRTQTVNLPTKNHESSTSITTRTHQCSVCQSSHKNRSSLLQHIKSHEEQQKLPASKRHSCNKCDKIFDAESALQKHLKSQHPIICKICEKIFKHPKHLWHHSFKHTEDNGLFKRFNCPSCKFKAMTRRALKRHFKRSHEMKDKTTTMLFVPIQEIKVEAQNDPE